MLRAYCDASKIPSGVFCVAGVAFGIDRAKKTERDFARLFGKDRLCHMTDLHAGKGEFADIDREESSRLCQGAVETINRYSTAVVAVSCDMAEVARLTPRTANNDAEALQAIVASAYSVCMHWMMYSMGSMFREDSSQRIQYWFELGDEFQGVARRFLGGMGSPLMRPLRDSYAYASDAFVAAEDARPFETADIVAWEWARHVDGLRAGRKTRRSLAALMGSECIIDGMPGHTSRGKYARHFSGKNLERFMGKVGRLMLATTSEEVAAAVTTRDWDNDRS